MRYVATLLDSSMVRTSYDLDSGCIQADSYLKDSVCRHMIWVEAPGAPEPEAEAEGVVYVKSPTNCSEEPHNVYKTSVITAHPVSSGMEAKTTAPSISGSRVLKGP